VSPDSIGVEELNADAADEIDTNIAHAYDDELECQDDDSDGSAEELDLDDLDQGEGYDDDQTVVPLPSSARARKSVRVPPPSGFKRNYASLADEFGKMPKEQGEVETASQDFGAENGESQRETSIRHRTAAIRNVEWILQYDDTPKVTKCDESKNPGDRLI
jgi:hypothetical protein